MRSRNQGRYYLCIVSERERKRQRNCHIEGPTIIMRKKEKSDLPDRFVSKFRPGLELDQDNLLLTLFTIFGLNHRELQTVTGKSDPYNPCCHGPRRGEELRCHGPTFLFKTGFIPNLYRTCIEQCWASNLDKCLSVKITVIKNNFITRK